jgi:hypothetical protein
MKNSDGKFKRSDLLDEQVVLRREVKLKSTLTAGGTCTVVRIKRNDADTDWDEVGEEFQVGPSPLQFEGTYDAENPLYGLVEYWPGAKKWKFYQLDFNCE